MMRPARRIGDPDAEQDFADLLSIVWSGLSEVISSWKMMVMSLPRTSRICRGAMVNRSWP
jgi:hypothetical protein